MRLDGYHSVWSALRVRHRGRAIRRERRSLNVWVSHDPCKCESPESHAGPEYFLPRGVLATSHWNLQALDGTRDRVVCAPRAESHGWRV